MKHRDKKKTKPATSNQPSKTPDLPDNLPEWVMTEAETGRRLDHWLAQLEIIGSRSKARAAIERGKVFLNAGEVTPDQAGEELQAGDTVRLWLDRPGSAKPRLTGTPHRSGLALVFEDDDLIVINKPAGLLVQPLPDDLTPTLLDLVTEYLRPRGKRQPLLVHRIDRDTSGLVLMAKNAKAQEILKAQFKRREPERLYWAIVHGTVQPAAGRWEDWVLWDAKRLIQRVATAKTPRARPALAEYRVLEQFSAAALLEVSLITGKRNQIRLQAGLRGHPLVGERKYLAAEPPRQASEVTLARQALHALQLGFSHPRSRKPLAFTAPLPEDMARLLKALRKKR